ncbi:hypothetical protein CK203_056398 [Vitis vinifera]|uniref:Retrotransposon gag domain-containing protein n=1 Tax=Vitis vinifera TaxID=29760 RepID=A0A438GPA2_VITVI|nr:hypothetical protein CK203_056398 [Vitis vinifera]
MTTNKERIELLEEKLGGVQEGMQRMEVGITDKVQRLEETITKLSEAFLSSRGSPSHNNYQQEGSHRTNRDTGENIWPFSSKIAKLEFSRFSGDDPTEWLNRVDQFFEFQEIAADQKVRLASFHLEGEANQLWQWFRKAFTEGQRSISWEAFEDEVRARFGPPDSEDFDVALSQEDETPKEMGGVNTTRKISEIEEDDNGKEPEITLHALTGWTPITPFIVRVANGERLSCKGKYEKLTVNLQGNEFHLDFFSVPLNGLDMVLGIQCSKDSRTMRNSHQICRQCWRNIQMSLLRLPAYHQHAKLITKYHSKTEPKAINVRPYRYAYFQKTEIENQDTTKYELAPLIFLKLLSALTMATMKSDMGAALGACPTYISRPSSTPILRQDEQMCVRQTRSRVFGHIITHRGVKVDEKKIEAMVAWPRPPTLPSSVDS